MDESLQIEPDKTAIGALLQAERGKQKLTRKQVAEVLNLSESMISSLENDEEISDISPTYVRGYQRAYVRLLGMNESEVLSSLPNVSTIERPQQDLHYFDKNLGLHSKKNSLSMLTKIVSVIVLFGIAFFSWPKLSSFLSLNDLDQISQNTTQTELEVLQSDDSDGKKLVIINSDTVADVNSENPVVDELSVNQDVDVTDHNDLNNSGISTRIINLANKLDQSEQLDNNAVQANANITQSGNQIESKISELLEPSDQVSPTTDQEVDGDQQAESASVNQQETQATITFVSNGASWLSIADAENNNLYRNTLKLDRVTVTGSLPLYVSTGNVNVLRVLAEQGEQQKVGIYDESKTVAKFFVDVDVEGRLKFIPK